MKIVAVFMCVICVSLSQAMLYRTDKMQKRAIYLSALQEKKRLRKDSRLLGKVIREKFNSGASSSAIVCVDLGSDPEAALKQAITSHCTVNGRFVVWSLQQISHMLLPELTKAMGKIYCDLLVQSGHGGENAVLLLANTYWIPQPYHYPHQKNYVTTFSYQYFSDKKQTFSHCLIPPRLIVQSVNEKTVAMLNDMDCYSFKDYLNGSCHGVEGVLIEPKGIPVVTVVDKKLTQYASATNLKTLTNLLEAERGKNTEKLIA